MVVPEDTVNVEPFTSTYNAVCVSAVPFPVLVQATADESDL